MLFDWFGTEVTAIGIVLLSYIVVRLLQEHSVLRRMSKQPQLGVPELCSSVKSPQKSENQSPQVTTSKPTGVTLLSRRSSETFSGDVDATLNAIGDQEDKLVDIIQDLCSKNYDAASALYFRGRERGLITATIPLADMFMGLCSACIRVGSPHFVFKYFGEMDDLGVSRDLNFYNSVIKILTFKKHYKINLSINDMCLNLVAAKSLSDPDSAVMAKSIFSCLLYSAVEAKEFWRALKYFRQLEKTSPGPSDKDCFNLFKALIAREDWNSLVAVLTRTSSDRMSRPGLTAVHSLVQHARVEQLAQLVNEASCTHLVALTLQEVKKCNYKESLLSAVLDRAVLSDQILVNLAAVIPPWEIEDKAIESVVGDLLQRPGLRASAILVINSLLRRVADAKTVFNSLVALLRNSLFSDSAVKPDMSTYSALIKLAPSVNQTMEVYRMFGEHRQMNPRMVADEHFMNSLLLSIASRTYARNQTSAVVAFGVVHDFASEGIRVSVKTVSILVSILTKSGTDESFGKCCELLSKSCRAEYGVVPEYSLFVPAVEAAIRMKRNQWVSRLFQALVDSSAGKSKVSADTVDGSLAEALRGGNEDAFCVLTELALVNRLPVRESTMARLKQSSKLQTVLNKYKYRLA